MALFKKKPPAPPKSVSLEGIVHERILTAEGWRRRMNKIKESGKAKTKPPQKSS